MTKKYELTDETITVDGHILYRIKALRSFNDVKKGDPGGFIQYESNLDHDGNGWVYNNAMVYDTAWVDYNVKIFNNAEIYDNAFLSGNSQVYGNAKVYGNASIFGDTKVYGNASIFGATILGGFSKIYGTAQISVTPDVIRDIKLNSGIWNQMIHINNRNYLISTTLQKISLGRKMNE